MRIMASIKKILPPQPHYLSGYSGFVDGYKFLCGQTYGRLTHDLFLKRMIYSKPLLTDLEEVNNEWLTPERRAVIEHRCVGRECKYSANMLPNYGGHVPQYKFLCGYKFTEQAAMGLNESEKLKRTCLCAVCMPVNDLGEHGHSFKKVPGGMSTFTEKYEHKLPMPPSATPYFLDNGDPYKNFVPGYCGHVPNLCAVYGHSYSPSTTRALDSFTARHEEYKASLGLPVTTTVLPVPKSFSQKLPYDTGIIKNYGGHIPGFKFNVGQTYSEGSKNTRRVLKGLWKATAALYNIVKHADGALKRYNDGKRNVFVTLWWGVSIEVFFVFFF